jgi:hypothetical protein
MPNPKLIELYPSRSLDRGNSNAVSTALLAAGASFIIVSIGFALYKQVAG